MPGRKWVRFASLMTVVSVLLAVCAPAPQTVIVTVEVPGPVQVVTVTPSPSPSPVPPLPKVLTVCLPEEPDTLYPLGGDEARAVEHVLQAVYDGPIDHRAHSYQPVILEKLPSLADGDAVFEEVTVRAGDMVVDDRGELVELTEGVIIRPAGCRSFDCAVEFAAEPITMERMVVTFRWKEGILWSDGEPLAADDSVYAFELASHPDTPANKHLVARTASYVAEDDTTTVWTGLPGYVDHLYFLNIWDPLPRHLWEEELGYSPADLLGAEESARLPMGWGPFVLDEWAPGEYISAFRNPNYFRAYEGLPHLERLVFRFAPDGSTERSPERSRRRLAEVPDQLLAQLLAGECDVIVTRGGHVRTFDRSATAFLLRLEEHGLLNVLSATTPAWEHIDLGINPVPTYDRPDFFEDLRVRQALIQCLNRQAIADQVTHGLGLVTDSYLPPDHPLYAGDQLRHWDHDPEAARAQLEEVGWTDADGDGVREAHGVESIRRDTPFEVRLLLPANSEEAQEIGRLVKAQLAGCGILVNLEFWPSWELFADGPAGPIFGLQFDLGGYAWYITDPPLCELYMSTQIPREGYWHSDASNVAGYIDPEYDAACQAARQAFPGTPEYERYHQRAQVILSQGLPAIPLFHRVESVVVRPRVLNLIVDSTEESEMWNVETFDIQP